MSCDLLACCLVLEVLVSLLGSWAVHLLEILRPKCMAIPNLLAHNLGFFLNLLISMASSAISATLWLSQDFFCTSRGAMCEVMRKSPWARKKEKRTGHQAETETKKTAANQTKNPTKNLARFVSPDG